MKLSYRLETIASLVPQGSKVADIGTDHGYIPIWLVKNNIAASALAMDVRKGPLARANEHIAEYGLTACIETRLSDGLSKLMPGEADTVIIAGMGGGLMIHILEGGGHVLDSVKQLILSPQSEIGEVRRYLAIHGYTLTRERMLKDEGKFYTVMVAEKGVMEYGKEIEYRYGKLLLDEKNAILSEYLDKEINMHIEIMEALKQQKTEGSLARLFVLSEELKLIEEARDEMHRNH